MAKGQTAVLRQLGSLFATGSVAGVPDHQLLERFVVRRDEFAEAAFAALVARHGPMVLKLCRNILRDSHDADDAFQATFLLLATKAARIGNRELLANWLYGVAVRTAMKARTRAARRLRHERRAAERSGGSLATLERDFELHAALHQGINALPEKYRSAVVLCHLEGMTREQAARLLGCPVSTVGVRLMRARERLRVWLTRRRHDFSASLIVADLDKPVNPAVPTALAEATTEAAMLVSMAARITGGATSASIVQLIKEVQMSLMLSKLKIAGSLLFVSLFMVGIASTAQPQTAPAPPRSAEQDVLDLERAWGDALVRCDAALMDRIVAYEMIGTDPGGHLWNKANYLESVKSGAFKIESFELADVKVKVYGDAAVATGRSILNKHSKSGLPRGGARYTDTYVRRGGCWQCVAWQSVGVPDQSDAQASRPTPPAWSKPGTGSTVMPIEWNSKGLNTIHLDAVKPGTEFPITPMPSEPTDLPLIPLDATKSRTVFPITPMQSEPTDLPLIPLDATKPGASHMSCTNAVPVPPCGSMKLLDSLQNPHPG